MEHWLADNTMHVMEKLDSDRCLEAERSVGKIKQIGVKGGTSQSQPLRRIMTWGMSSKEWVRIQVPMALNCQNGIRKRGGSKQ